MHLGLWQRSRIVSGAVADSVGWRPLDRQGLLVRHGSWGRRILGSMGGDAHVLLLLYHRWLRLLRWSCRHGRRLISLLVRLCLLTGAFRSARTTDRRSIPAWLIKWLRANIFVKRIVMVVPHLGLVGRFVVGHIVAASRGLVGDLGRGATSRLHGLDIIRLHKPLAIGSVPLNSSIMPTLKLEMRVVLSSTRMMLPLGRLPVHGTHALVGGVVVGCGGVGAGVGGVRVAVHGALVRYVWLAAVHLVVSSRIAHRLLVSSRRLVDRLLLDVHLLLLDHLGRRRAAHLLGMVRLLGWLQLLVAAIRRANARWCLLLGMLRLLMRGVI